MLANLSSAMQVASGGDFSDKKSKSPELRALLETFVSSSDEIAYATLLNFDAKGISAGRIAPTHSFSGSSSALFAARDGRVYSGQRSSRRRQKRGDSLSGQFPGADGPRFMGMIATVSICNSY